MSIQQMCSNACILYRVAGFDRAASYLRRLSVVLDDSMAEKLLPSAQALQEVLEVPDGSYVESVDHGRRGLRIRIRGQAGVTTVRYDAEGREVSRGTR